MGTISCRLLCTLYDSTTVATSTCAKKLSDKGTSQSAALCVVTGAMLMGQSKGGGGGGLSSISQDVGFRLLLFM